MNWCEIGRLSDRSSSMPITMAMPPANCVYVGHENVRLEFYFTYLIFVVCQSTMKTAKIGSLENFQLYSNILGMYDVKHYSMDNSY